MPVVAIYLVSDLHGAVDDLKKAVPEHSTLLVLGDLINFLDYFSMTGILTEVFSIEAVQEVAKLRAEGDYEQARSVIAERSAGREDEIRMEIGERVHAEYEALFAALPDPTYLILGNVDAPPVAHKLALETPAVVEADTKIFTLGGELFGFVGGALPTPMHVAGEITEEEMRDKIDRLGEVDVLCTHIPPAVPELCYDTVAGKLELGSRDILRYIEEVQPRLAYFGHVHQPLVSSMQIGRTRCVNVGYFRATKRPFRHDPKGDRWPTA
jgi:Icc-related predicted phosphoesterase